MKKQISKLFSLLLAVIMVIGLFPTTAFAEEVDVSKLPTPNFYITVNNMPNDTDLSLNTFKAGEKIEYRFSVYNPSEYTVVPTEAEFFWGDEKVTDNNAPGIWTNPGKTVNYSPLFKHIVTEEEARTGCVFTEATMEYSYYIGDELVPGTRVTASHILPVGEYAGFGGVHVKKTVTNKPTNGICFMEGDTVNFTTYVVNYTDHPVNGLKVTEDRNGSKEVEYTAPADFSLAPGQITAINSSYVVSQMDFLLRSLYSYSTVTWNDNEDDFIDLDTSITSNVVQVPVGADDGSEADDAFVSIVISPVAPPANGIYYVLGERIELKFEIVNQSYKNSAKDLAVEITGMDWSIGNDTEELLGTQSLWSDTYASHTVDWHDIFMGGVKVQAYVDAWDAETDEYCGSFSNVLALPVYGSISDWPDWKDQNIRITQKLETIPANGKYFEAGETIEITVTTHEEVYGRFEMFKNYNYNTLHTAKGSELVYLEDLALSLKDNIDERSQTFSYKVTPEDARRGWICSEIYGWAEYDVVSRTYMESGRPEYDTEYDKFYYGGEPLVVPCGYAEVTGNISADLKQTFTPNNGEYYVAGEYVDLTYTINNTLSGSLRNPSASLNADNGKTIDLSDELPKVLDAWHRNFTYYKVTKEDVEKGFITFTYSVSGTTVDGNTKNATSKELTVLCGEAKDPALEVQMVEVSTPDNGEYYTEGEIVEYKVTIKNNGNIDFDECSVRDSSEFGSIEELVIGDEESFPYNRTVTQEDISNGIGVAVVFARTELSEEWLHSSCMAYFPTGAEAANELRLITKSVTSAPANGEYYTEGETVSYEIAVKIDEELLGKDWSESYEFRVLDELTSDMELCEFGEGDSFKMTAKYTVTAEDVKAGSVANVATLQWRDNISRNWYSSMNSNVASVYTGEGTTVDPGEDEEPKSTEYAIEVTKIIEGENAPTDTMFSFQFKDGYKTCGMFITGAGTKAFAPLYFTKTGTYTYTVSEVDGGKKGWTYDDSETEVSIEIIETETESGESTLKVGTVTFTKDGVRVNGVSFTNIYDGSGEEPGVNPGEDEAEKYDITVINGKATDASNAVITESEEGKTVTIKADTAPLGKMFDKWIIKSDTKPTLTKATDSTTTFTMPEGPVTVEATYKDIPATKDDDKPLPRPSLDNKPTGDRNPLTGAPTEQGELMFVLTLGIGTVLATVLRKKKYNR